MDGKLCDIYLVITSLKSGNSWKVFERCSLSSFGETCLVYRGFGSGVDEGIANSQRNSAIFNPRYPICSGCLTSAVVVVPRLNVSSVRVQFDVVWYIINRKRERERLDQSTWFFIGKLNKRDKFCFY